MLSGINQASQMASQLFSRIDTKNQGYIEKSDLASAFSQISEKGQSDSTVDDVFSTLDSNSDGKVTKDEFSSVLAQLQEQMTSRRMQNAGGGGQQGGPQGVGGMPPPPPRGEGPTLSKDELVSQLASDDGSDAERTSLMTTIVNNFDAADTDGDGKVSFKEATAYDQSTKTDASSSASSTNTANSEAQVMMKIMQLVHAYGQDQSQSGLSTLLSTSA